MDYYDSIAEGYDELYRDEQERKIQVIANHLQVKDTDLILDVGCGTGISTDPWKCKKIGIDPSIKLLEKAKQGFLVNAEAEHIPFKDNTFDIVISVTAIQNFRDIKKGLKEIKRVGKESFIFSILKRSKKYDKIKKQIQMLFKIKKIIHEKKDIIFLCSKL